MRAGHLRFSLSALALFILPACVEPKVAVPERAPAPLPSGVPAPGAPDVPWNEKNRDQKMEFMGLHFFPEMRAAFRSHDPNADFRCQTCHGEDMEAVNFRMPNGLFPLPRENPIAAATEYDEKTTAFMNGEIVPLARKLLGDAPAGASPCHSCHPVATDAK
ncbi:MAG TPA: hypothetical protein VHE30_04775 [Polyangiaceae bacterium]|nr:hypothetical protein [Polyangiaceae bacterium]